LKLKCCGCKDRFDKETMSKHPNGWFHSIECVIQYARKKKDKQIAKSKREEIKKIKKRKSDFYANDTKTRKANAKFHCHRYIRERDKNDSCICCDLPLGKNYDAGHFLESGNNSALRYDEDNIHGQSVHCNQYKGGNPVEYQKRLRLKIGDKRVDSLLDNKGGVVKRTAQDYLDIEHYYKEKLKELQIDQG